ncbi:MAG: hypothetical protein OXB95_03875 [Rhodobacteraceae bacterium]|nr:hypothetical protein [Paracoccaceae bacterium]
MLERPAGARDEAADMKREAEPDKAAVLEKTLSPRGIKMEM